VREAELLCAESELFQSIICICRKSAYPYGYMPENNRLPRSIRPFSSFRHRFKLLPAAYMAHVHLKLVGATCISS
jgi:hypothetical protein